MSNLIELDSHKEEQEYLEMERQVSYMNHVTWLNTMLAITGFFLLAATAFMLSFGTYWVFLRG